MTTTGILHLTIGPVGAGKSTFARERTTRNKGVFLDVDAWMVRLYGEDVRPEEDVIAWYVERRQRCRDLLWSTTRDILASGSDVFLELGLVSALEREVFYDKARDEELEFSVYLLDAPRDVRRMRVLERNREAGEYTQIVPMEFFERASDAWEPPSEAERRSVRIVDV